MLRRIFSMLMAVISCILSLVGWNGMIQVEDAHYEMVDQALINPNADESAKALYRFLLDCYGKRVISGQISTSMRIFPRRSSAWMNRIQTARRPYSRQTSFGRCTALQTHIRR